MLSGLDHCAMVPEAQMGEGMGIVGKGIGIWVGVIWACDQAWPKIPARFVIPAGDTLALLALVAPSGATHAFRRLCQLGEVEGGFAAVGEADDHAGGVADGLQAGVQGGQEQVVGLFHAADGGLGDAEPSGEFDLGEFGGLAERRESHGVGCGRPRPSRRGPG